MKIEPFNEPLAYRRAEINQMEKALLIDSINLFVREAVLFLEHVKVFESNLTPHRLLLNLDLLESFGRLNEERVYIKNSLGNRTPGQRHVRGKVVLTDEQYRELSEQFTPIANQLMSFIPHHNVRISNTEVIKPSPLGIGFPVFYFIPQTRTYEAKMKLDTFMQKIYVAMEEVFIANGGENMVDSIYVRSDGFKGNDLESPLLSFDKYSLMWKIRKYSPEESINESINESKPFYLSEIIEIRK